MREKKCEDTCVSTKEEQGPYDVTCTGNTNFKHTSIVVNLAISILTH